MRLTGRPLAESYARRSATPDTHRYLPLALMPSDRSVLHARIADRFDAMLTAGLEDEVDFLRGKYRLSLELPSMRCVGYRQVWEAQDGIAPRGEMRDRGIYATRQLAKRQILHPITGRDTGAILGQFHQALGPAQRRQRPGTGGWIHRSQQALGRIQA